MAIAPTNGMAGEGTMGAPETVLFAPIVSDLPSEAGSVERGKSGTPAASRSPHLPSPQPAPIPSLTSTAAGPGSTLPSPPMATIQHQIADFPGQYESLKSLILHTDGSVVRQVVRDTWQKCLMGSEFHVGFLTDAALCQVTPPVFTKALKSSGRNLLRHAKVDIIKQLSVEDLNEVADAIISKVSNHFLDRAFARRLETIGAQELVNALARAERLGYDADDVVEPGTMGAQSEHVIPALHPGPPAPPRPNGTMSYPPQAPPPPANGWNTYTPKPAFPNAPAPAGGQGPPPKGRRLPPGVVCCLHCQRPCSNNEAVQYHYKRANCRKERHQWMGSNVCIHCGAQFAGPGGLTYHVKSAVCGKHEPETEGMMKALLESIMGSQTGGKGKNVPMPMAAASPVPVPAPGTTPSTTHTPVASRVVPSSSSPAGVYWAAAGTTPKQAMSSSPLTRAKYVYEHLTPENRQAFEVEMRRAEALYGDQLRQAMKLPKDQQDAEIAKIKNRFNTKQSTTRKKYGIRLRERRTMAEMEEERQRLLSTGVKRGQPAEESPRKRVPLTEMGGLSGSQATAELVDPTASLPPAVKAKALAMGKTKGTPDDPMQIDSGGESSDSDNGDIPARIKGKGGI